MNFYFIKKIIERGKTMSSIKCLERALDILDLMYQNGGKMTLTQISNELSLYKSTVHRTLLTLEGKEFIQRDEFTGMYTLGSRVFMMGLVAARSIPISKIARPQLSYLSEKYDEYADLSVLDNGIKGKEGSFENRMRFALETIEMIKEEVGKDFIIGYRMGGNEPNLEDGKIIAKTLEAKGVDLLHVSAGIQGETIPETPKDFPYNWIVYMGTEIKNEVKIPVIVVNGIKTPSQGAYLVENDLADFVAIGRGHLVDPNWANKAELNKEPSPCLKCPKCLWFKDGRNCPGRKK